MTLLSQQNHGSRCETPNTVIFVAFFSSWTKVTTEEKGGKYYYNWRRRRSRKTFCSVSYSSSTSRPCIAMYSIICKLLPIHFKYTKYKIHIKRRTNKEVWHLWTDYFLVTAKIIFPHSWRGNFTLAHNFLRSDVIFVSKVITFSAGKSTLVKCQTPQLIVFGSRSHEGVTRQLKGELKKFFIQTHSASLTNCSCPTPSQVPYCPVFLLPRCLSGIWPMSQSDLGISSSSAGCFALRCLDFFWT